MLVTGRKKAIQRAYEATSEGRRLGNWDAPRLSPNTAITPELDKLRDRSHALTRNVPWISRALKVDVANEIGTGIIPRPNTSNKAFNDELLELWEDFIHVCDASGQLSAYGLQWAASRARKEAGEVFIRIIRKKRLNNSPVPLQFQLLESTFCPTQYNLELPNGNRIISGVEVDKLGRVVAYHIYQSNPSEELYNYSTLLRVKADDMIHHFIPNRPGQLRGEPQGVQSTVRAHVYDKYDSAELGRKESRSNFTGVIRRPEYNDTDFNYDPISGQPISEDDDEVPMIDLEAGTFPNLLPGEDITVFDGDDAGRGYADFQRFQLLGISAGWDVPYQLISGDYTEINDRLWRAIINEYHRETEQTQELFVIVQVCRKMWTEFVNRAVISGAIVLPTFTSKFEYLRCKHRPPAWAYIHPVQDVDAKIKLIEGGLSSRSKEVDKMSGDSVEEIDNQRAADMERELSLGITEEMMAEEENDTGFNNA